MKRLWVWIVFSLALHFFLIRFVSFREEPFEQHATGQYQVTLLYRIPETPELKEEKPGRIKSKTKEKKVEQKIEALEKIKEEQRTAFTEPEEKAQVDKEETRAVEETEMSQEVMTNNVKNTDNSIQLTESDENVDPAVVIEGLRERIMKELVYPYIARKKGIQGVVYVTLRLDENGNLLDVHITRSSGYKSLDNAAVQLVQKVVPYQHNLGKSLSVQIPIRYSLIN
jgi:protein TonB